MWNRRNRLLPESRRGIGGSVRFHFRAAVPAWAVCVKQKQALVLGSARGQGRAIWGGGRCSLNASARLSGKKRKCLEDLFAQPPRIAVHGMPDPRLHRLFHRFHVDEPRIVVRVKPA